MINKKSAVVISLIFVILLVVSCMKQPEQEIKEVETQEDLLTGNYTIAISQYADYEAMNQCKNGFMKKIQKAGVVEGNNLTLSYQNAGAEKKRAQLIATSYTATEPDLIYCIGSTSSIEMLSTMHLQEIPIIFADVVDPISAELCDEDGVQRNEITGVSTPFRSQKQMQLIQRLLPQAKKIGILYSSDEQNSRYCVEQYRMLARKNGMELVLRQVESIHELNEALDECMDQVDCFVNIQDGLVSSQLPVILEKTLECHVPVFGCDEYQVRDGCIAAQGIDYELVGEEAGKFAIEVLVGRRKASQIPFEKIEEDALFINSEVANQLGIKIPDDIDEEAEKVFDKIGEQGE